MSEGSAEASGAESPLLPAEEITAPARAARESEWISFINLRSATREEVGGCNGCTAKTETVTLVVLRSIEFRLCDECRESLSRMLANEPAPILVDGRVMRGDVEIEPKCPICGKRHRLPVWRWDRDMNPTPIGYLAIGLGILIVIAGGLAGGNLFIIGIGLVAIALGGSTKKTKPCPFCRSAIDARATTCPKCTKDQPK